MSLNPVETDLFVRYSMDPQIWRAAQLKSAIHSIPLKVIVGAPMVLPLLFLLINRGIKGLVEKYSESFIEVIQGSMEEEQASITLERAAIDLAKWWCS